MKICWKNACIKCCFMGFIIVLCLCGCKKTAQIDMKSSTLVADNSLSSVNPGILLNCAKVKKNCLVLSITNMCEETFYYQEPERIEMSIKRMWYPLVRLKEVDGIAVVSTDMAFSVESGQTKEIACWLKYYDATCLEPGEYRIFINCCMDNKSWETVYIPFQID